jgi:5-methylcytosine-specific restriction endonuclease McrA
LCFDDRDPLNRLCTLIYIGGEVLLHKESFKPSKLSLHLKSDYIPRKTGLTDWAYRSDRLTRFAQSSLLCQFWSSTIPFNYLCLTIWLTTSLINHHHHPRLSSNLGICALFLINFNQGNESQLENLWLSCNNENKRMTCTCV